MTIFGVLSGFSLFQPKIHRFKSINQFVQNIKLFFFMNLPLPFADFIINIYGINLIFTFQKCFQTTHTHFNYVVVSMLLQQKITFVCSPSQINRLDKINTTMCVCICAVCIYAVYVALCL